MGTTKSSHNDFKANEWSKLLSDENNNVVLVSNKDPSLKIVEHSFKASSDKDFKKASKLYKLRKNSKNIVATMFQNYESEKCCSSNYSGNVYTEWIPITLNNVVHLPFPDILHVYKQALEGADSLSNSKGCFLVNEEMIGVNCQNVAKIYHNSDFSQVKASHRVKEEDKMLHSIIETIEKNTDYNTMPRENPSFRDYLYREHKSPNLENALHALEQYAGRYNGGRIPEHLECVRVNGGAENIRNTWFAERGNESNHLRTNESTHMVRESNASHNFVGSSQNFVGSRAQP